VVHGACVADLAGLQNPSGCGAFAGNLQAEPDIKGVNWNKRMPALTSPALEQIDDATLAGRARDGDAAAARTVITRNNQRLYRAAFAILKDKAEAEEAVQEGYLKAFAALDSFQGESAFSTWLTRIVINEALGRRRSAQRHRRQLEDRGVALMDDYREALMSSRETPEPADAAVIRRQVAGLLEGAISRLPDAFRTVFVLREVNELSVEETAEALGLAEQTVKTRLFRARRRLRDDLGPELKSALSETFQFAGRDCAGLTDRVLERLGLS
jgi:RNA polymerase sigma-70 factor (ECF subfamily)